MSGGEYQYMYYKVEDIYCNRMHDAELNELIKDLVPVLQSVEWWQSGDTEEKDYRDIVKEFKEKWFKQDRDVRLKDIISDQCEQLKENLLKMI